MPIFKFIGHNLTELFVKTGNWWQKHIDKRAWNNVCLQYSVLRRKHNQDIITRTFLHKSVDTSTSVTCAKFTLLRVHTAYLLKMETWLMEILSEYYKAYSLIMVYLQK